MKVVYFTEAEFIALNTLPEDERIIGGHRAAFAETAGAQCLDAIDNDLDFEWIMALADQQHQCVLALREHLGNSDPTNYGPICRN